DNNSEPCEAGHTENSSVGERSVGASSARPAEPGGQREDADPSLVKQGCGRAGRMGHACPPPPRRERGTLVFLPSPEGRGRGCGGGFPLQKAQPPHPQPLSPEGRGEVCAAHRW